MKIEHKSVSASKAAAVRDYISARGCEVFEPGTDGYSHTTQIWNGAVAHEPALIARCLTVGNVQSSLAAAQAHGLPISVRGGGHDWAGRGLRHGGLVLDLSGMRQVSVNLEAKEATIAGGATAADVSVALGSSGLVAVTGNTGAGGMAGLLLGGGYGPLTTRFGLASDSLVGVELVLADGWVVKANESHNTDLFWALRGGGGNFGVVTSTSIRLHPVGALMSGMILFPWTDARSVLRGYAEIMSSAPDELAVAVAMSVAPDGDPVIVLAPTWSGDPKQGKQVIARLQSFGTPVVTKIAPMTLGEIFSLSDAQLVDGRHYEVRTRWLHDLTPDSISTLMAAYSAKTSPFTRIVLHHFHGAGTRVAPDATAFGMRQEHFTAIIYSTWESVVAGESAVHRQWASDLFSRLAPFALPGGYANLLGPDAREQISAAYGGNGRRLGELKRKFDPDNVFSSAIPLPPCQGKDE